MSELLVSLMAFALAATISPGGATTLATASGAQFGFKRSLPLMAGIAAGLASLVAASALGLGALTHTIPELELWLRIAGTVYLLWLAWTIGRQGSPGSSSSEPATPIGFVAGLLLLWANPKGWTMAIAAAGTYARLADHPVTLAANLGAVFGLAASLSLAAWCAGGVWLARSIRTERAWRVLNAAMAVLLVGSITLMWR